MARKQAATLDERLAALRRSAESVRDAENEAQKSARLGMLVKRATELADRRDALAQKLESGFVWLEKNDGSEDHEEKWLAWLSEYERISDALDAAQGVWTAPREMVS